jgi:hypothetical protein
MGAIGRLAFPGKGTEMRKPNRARLRLLLFARRYNGPRFVTIRYGYLMASDER